MVELSGTVRGSPGDDVAQDAVIVIVVVGSELSAMLLLPPSGGAPAGNGSGGGEPSCLDKPFVIQYENPCSFEASKALIDVESPTNKKEVRIST
jgi:hypothetical protein